MFGVGQDVGVFVHVTVPPCPVLFQSPAIPKVPALTSSAFPLVSKFPLSIIPQLGPLSVAFPLMLTPSMLLDGAPKVYKQPFPFPPLTFVATARAVMVSVLVPKTLMK
jgi:hypothetical protein